MRISRREKNLAWLLVTGLAAGLLVLVLEATGALQRAEWMTYDARMALLRDAQPAPEEIAVILVDDDSLEEMEDQVGRFPWPRWVYADLIEFLSRGNPRAVVMDILFAERQELVDDDAQGLGEDDQYLVDWTERAGHVHHAFWTWRNVPGEEGAALVHQPLPEDFTERHGLGPAGDYPDPGYNAAVLPFEGLGEAAAGVGNIALSADADGVQRRLHPVSPYQLGLSSSIAHQELFSSLGLSPFLAEENAGEENADPPGFRDGLLKTGSRNIPVDEDGRTPLNFYGDMEAYSFSGILENLSALRAGALDEMWLRPDEFEDRIVYVGASAVGLGDIKHTPVDANMPGVKVHATLAGNYLEDDFLTAAPAWLTPLLVMVFALLTAAGMAFNRPGPRLAPGALLLVGWGGLSLWLFGQNWVVDMVAPAGAVLASGLAGLAYVSATEGRDKRRVRRMLSQYVSPAVLAEVVDRHEDHLRAEVGTAERMTLLFTDIRGFTGISESYPPEQVVGLLNRYFSELTEVIFDHQGTLDKFIGDAVMAFWGAPIRIPDHADRAVLAAVAIHRRLEAFNRQIVAEGQPELRTGLGIHTGEVVLGNIGSEKKLDYTVIGDNVNLGSRIEGLTSKYGCPVLVSEATRDALQAEIPCALVDRVRVKGKREAIGIYRPLAVPGDGKDAHARARAIREATEVAWEAYCRADWSRAMDAWRQLPEDDPVRVDFLARCEALKESGVPEDWDGIRNLDSK